MNKARNELRTAVDQLEQSLDAAPGMLTAEELKMIQIRRAQSVVNAARQILAELEGRKTVYRGDQS